MGFVLLRDWSERKSPQLSASAVAGARLCGRSAAIRDAMAFAFMPPPVIELGPSAGFDFYLKDDKGQGHTALVAARNQFLGMAVADKLLANVRPNGAGGRAAIPDRYRSAESDRAGTVDGRREPDAQRCLGRTLYR